jgi:hypothetical protein
MARFPPVVASYKAPDRESADRSSPAVRSAPTDLDERLAAASLIGFATIVGLWALLGP